MTIPTRKADSRRSGYSPGLDSFQAIFPGTVFRFARRCQKSVITRYDTAIPLYQGLVRRFSYKAKTLIKIQIVSLSAFLFGGLEGIRTLDPHNAKRHIKLFCIIPNCFWRFPLGFSFFPPLFSTLISMCYAAVCGVSCGQKRSPPFAGNGFPAWTGSIFRASNCLHCNSEGRIQQVISAPSRTQKLGGCKQKRHLASRD